MKKPKVKVNCVANTYAGSSERIIEFSGNNTNQGGLISFSFTDDGKMRVDVYRQGADVVVNVGKPDEKIA